MIDNDKQLDTLALKARMLAGGTVGFRHGGEIKNQQIQMNLGKQVDIDNLHGNKWIFFRLNKNTRVRMTLTECRPSFVIEQSPQGCNRVLIKSSEDNLILADGIEIEHALVHCPGQLFFGLYEYCSTGCLFCPLTFRKDPVAFTVDEMLQDIARHERVRIGGIGITTGIPPNMTAEEVGIELASVVRKLADKTNKCVPIGISTKHPSKEVLYMLRDAGATEVRLNIEIFNIQLAKRLMPNKHIDDVLLSIEYACAIFGCGKVSSNMIVGIGETDDDIFSGIETLAKMGAVATLYPYDPVPESKSKMLAMVGDTVGIPSAERLLRLAIRHKEILSANGLEKSTLHTMCPACAASHIMPGIDF